MGKPKKPTSKFDPTPSKKPKAPADPSSYWHLKPSWRISILEMRDPFGWHEIGQETLDRIRNRLVGFESMTWQEILVSGRKQNHSIRVYRLCTEAQKRLGELNLDDQERIYSLRVTGTERIFGFLNAGVMDVLWWDPSHSVCPALTKHT